MKALTLWQPWATLVALGVKSIETRSWATSYRGPIAFHAAARKPWASGIVGEWLPQAVYGTNSQKWRLYRTRGSEAHDLPLGAIVATATLADVVPIIDNCGTDMEAPIHVCMSGGALLMHWPEHAPLGPDGDTEREVTDQLPYGDFSTPGRFAWLLEDVKPTTERCPACWGQGCYVRALDGRDLCDRTGRCEPVPAKGRQGLWEWAS